MERGQFFRLHRSWVGWIAATVIVLLGVCGSTWAFEIPTGIDDLEIHWDNTLKYNFGVRLQDQQRVILRSLNFNDGDLNFHRGRIVSSRFDDLSEFEVRYMKDFGFRVSASGWYDPAYEELDDHSLLTSNSIKNGRQTFTLSTVSDRLNRGPYGEVLDAFVYGKVNAGPIPINIRVGRHTIYWGESISNNQSISYSQAPMDIMKAVGVPGSELKEVFRPLFQVSAVAQLTPSLFLAGQQYFQWEEYRNTPDGGYLAAGDIFTRGSRSILLAAGNFFLHGRDREPNAENAFGVSLRWSPPWLNGTGGVYYRRFADMVPSQTVLDLARKQYFFSYANNIDLYGVSLSQQILGFSVGTEFSFRHNMALASDPMKILPKMALPEHGTIDGARGDTYHMVINAARLFKKNPLYDTGTAVVELGWSGYSSINHDRYDLFTGRTQRHGVDTADKNALGLLVSFSPQWLQVFPGMDLTMPIVWTGGIKGQTPVITGPAAGCGTYSMGLALDVKQRYTFTLSYVGYYGRIRENPNTLAVGSFSNPNALLGDRGFINFTFKTNL